MASSRFTNGLRELPTNVAGSFNLNDPKLAATSRVNSQSTSVRSSIDTGSGAGNGFMMQQAAAAHVQSRDVSPHADRRNRGQPTYCADMIAEISEMYFRKERHHPRTNTYLTTRQTEVTEKMRAIVVDWLIDVAIKFRLRPETFYLAIDVMDRYLTVCATTRAQLQLVGITSLLIAAKHEEMWAPDVRECIKITANTYTRDDILVMERAICAALTFRFTVPTVYPFVERLLQVSNADTTTRCAAFYFLEHAMMDYNMLAFLPSTIANAAVYLANVLLRKPASWTYELQYYGKATVAEFRPCAEQLLRYAHHVSGAKYQAVRRKYATPKYSDITQRPLPEALPME